MSKIKLEWVDTGYFSHQVEVPQSKKAFEKSENRRINHQVKQINRQQRNIMFTQYGRTR